MLTRDQAERIGQEAFLPEQLPGYVEAVSGREPFCCGDFLVYAGAGVLAFIGYPLGVPFDPQALEERLAETVKTHRPRLVSLIAPALPPSLGAETHPSDHYYCLDLQQVRVSAKTRNMLVRAGRELRVETDGGFGPEHHRLVEGFLDRRAMDEGGRAIYARIGRYLSSCPSARLFSARREDGTLAGFDVADFGPGKYAFYMFNCTAADRHCPGTSDLLLARVIAAARGAGKSHLNLGLGISPGIASFKRKWGGSPFRPYLFHQFRPAARGLLEMLLQQW